MVNVGGASWWRDGGPIYHSHVVKVVTTMGKKCIAFGCSKTHKNDVSLFKFPTESNLRRAWILQVKRTRDKWDGPSEHSTLCSDHFTEDCFEPMSILSKQMGLKRQQRLKPGAIPTIFPIPASVPAPKRPHTYIKGLWKEREGQGK